MPNYTDLNAVADRIRSATASLTRGEDAEAVRAYLRELEQLARERARDASKPPLYDRVHGGGIEGRMPAGPGSE